MKAAASKSLALLLEALEPHEVARMVGALGGTKWSVPTSGLLPEGHLWAEVLGTDRASVLARYLAGEADVRIPRDLQVLDGLIYQSRQQGLSVNQLAVMYKKDVRSITRAVNRHHQALQKARQGSLF